MKITEENIANADDLSAVDELVSKCERCSLYKTKTKDVTGIGSEKAQVMFIGEAPGKDEDLQGEPFVGRAGQLLTELIQGLGWERKDVYIANVLKHRPPNNRDPLPEEAEMCWPYLKQQIKIIDPKLIVFLGRHAMNRFFPALKISECHGNAFRKDFNGRKQVFLALYHPAVAIYNGNMKKTLEEDFDKIPKILKKINEEGLNNNNDNNKETEQTKLF
ncbi:MAG: uracil-DNA glycosylase [bacterium]|nr:uracil-DNA glycosylase [bacterium]